MAPRLGLTMRLRLRLLRLREPRLKKLSLSLAWLCLRRPRLRVLRLQLHVLLEDTFFSSTSLLSEDSASLCFSKISCDVRSTHRHVRLRSWSRQFAQTPWLHRNSWISSSSKQMGHVSLFVRRAACGCGGEGGYTRGSSGRAPESCPAWGVALRKHASVCASDSTDLVGSNFHTAYLLL